MWATFHFQSPVFHLASPSQESRSHLRALPAKVSPEASAATTQTAAMALTGLGCSFRILAVPRAPITASPVLFSGGFGYTCLFPPGALSKLGITSKIPLPDPESGAGYRQRLLGWTTKHWVGSYTLPNFRGP